MKSFESQLKAFIFETACDFLWQRMYSVFLLDLALVSQQHIFIITGGILPLSFYHHIININVAN